MMQKAGIDMNFVISVIQDVILICLSIWGFLIRRKRSRSGCSNTVFLSSLLLWTGFLCGSIFSIPLTLSNPTTLSYGTRFVFEIAVLLCIAMLLAYCNNTVVYDASGFTARNLLGRKYTCRYEELTGISRKSGSIILRCGKRKIILDSMASGREKFIAFADKSYFKLTHTHIPEHTAKHDPMNGNLNAPWLYFSIYFIMAACWLGFIFLAAFVLKPADGSVPVDAIEIYTELSSYEYLKKDHGTLIFHSPDYEKPFYLSYLTEYEITPPEPSVLCSRNTYRLTVHETNTQYKICAVSTEDGDQIISALDANIAYKNSQRGASIALLIMCVIFFILSVHGILVGRYPERYPRNFRKLFYKDIAWSRNCQANKKSAKIRKN